MIISNNTKIKAGRLSKGFPTPGGLGNNVSVKEESLGTETINGYRCEKKRIKTTTDMMGNKMTFTSLVWITAELGFPIRTETDNGTITELRDIKPGHQDASLFEIPAGYTKVASIMEVMGNRINSRPDRGQQSGMPKTDEMPAALRKMIEEQMKKGQ
jgi:hypothetical protein